VENLREISWDDWFEAFDANGLALVYDPGSRFNKIVAARQPGSERKGITTRRSTTGARTSEADWALVGKPM